jgi:hypothetical protein
LACTLNGPTVLLLRSSSPRSLKLLLLLWDLNAKLPPTNGLARELARWAPPPGLCPQKEDAQQGCAIAIAIDLRIRFRRTRTKLSSCISLSLSLSLSDEGDEVDRVL